MRLLRLCSLIAVAVLLAGCHKLDARTSIESDGSGEVRMGIGFSAEERANLEAQNPDQQAFCNPAQAPPDAAVLEEQRGAETWCITITRFEDLEELGALYEQRSGIKVNRVEMADGRLVYDLTLDTSSEESSLSGLTDITWTLTLPGTVLAHNADEEDGNTLTWRPEPKSGDAQLQAASEVPPSGIQFPPCGAALLVVGVAVFRASRRKLPASG